MARYAPVGPAISGLQSLSDDDSVQGLIQQLGGIKMPGIGDLNTDQLDQLFP